MKDGERLVIWWPYKKHAHLGDCWAAVNSGLFIAQKNKLKSIKLSVSLIYGIDKDQKSRRWPGQGNVHFMRDLLPYIDYGNIDVEIVPMEDWEEEEKFKLDNEFRRLGIPMKSGKTPQYNATYLPTKVKRVSPDQIQKKICYCFQANYMKKRLPANLDKLIEGIQQRYPDHELVELGLPMTIGQDIRHLSECKFYIGACTGISHLCRSVIGVPMILVDPVIAFPSHACQRRLIKLINSSSGELTNLDKLLIQISRYEREVNNKCIT